MLNNVLSFLARNLSGAVLKRFRAQCREPERVQLELLQHILEKNQDTAYGREHRFAEIFGFAEFQAQVPLADYEDLEPYIKRSMEGEPGTLTTERPILYATTSGTTGPSKYIPVTPESKSAKAQLMRVWLAGLVRDNPRIFAKRVLVVVSPEIESYAPDGTPCGAESGHGYKNIPRLIQTRYACPYEVYAIKDYHSKYYALLRFAVEQQISFIYCCNPSTVLLIGELMEEHGPQLVRDIAAGTLSGALELPTETRRLFESKLKPNPSRSAELGQLLERHGKLSPRHVWPDLAAIACWKGGTVEMYLEKLDRYFPADVPIRDIGYFASELRGSVPLSDEGDSGPLAVQTNVYEFWPADTDEEPVPERLLRADQLEAGRKYQIFVTTVSGLYRYNMHDIIEVTGFFERTPLIRFLQKGKGFVSFTGEKLSEPQVLEAARQALGELGPQSHFIAAVGEMQDTTAHYNFLVEFDQLPAEHELEAALERFEHSLRELNVEYAAKRDSLRLGPPRLRCIRKGEFNRYRRDQVEGGKSDGQFKILRVTADPAFLDQFAVERELQLEPPAAQANERAAY